MNLQWRSFSETKPLASKDFLFLNQDDLLCFISRSLHICSFKTKPIVKNACLFLSQGRKWMQSTVWLLNTYKQSGLKTNLFFWMITLKTFWDVTVTANALRTFLKALEIKLLLVGWKKINKQTNNPNYYKQHWSSKSHINVIKIIFLDFKCCWWRGWRHFQVSSTRVKPLLRNRPGGSMQIQTFASVS